MSKFIDRLVIWVRHNELLYELFQINQPSQSRNVQMRKQSNIESYENKTFDLRKPKIDHRRTVSSSFGEREDKLSIVIASQIVRKTEILKLKQKFEALCLKNRGNIPGLIPVLNEFGYKINGITEFFQGKLLSFKALLEFLYRKATKNQILRLLKFSGETVNEELSVEKEKQNIEKTKANRKLLTVYRNLFEKYDLNKDGKIDLKELKLGLQKTMTEEGIEKLFENFKKEHSGISFLSFIRMYAPESLEIPESIDKTF